jgi:putative endonuclease
MSSAVIIPPLKEKECSQMKYVYLLRSRKHVGKRYIGISSDPGRRIKEHNEGKSPHTSKFRPWELVVVIGFKNESKALEFEKYLKSGSGRAFANRHLW